MPDAERRKPESFLNTREAAQLLRVSQASIRRWADAGLLRSGRIGRRGERRFTPEDLQRYLEACSTGTPVPTPSSVFVGGSTTRRGSHLAALFATDAGRFRLALPFLRHGLKAAEPCLLIAASSIANQYRDALESDQADRDQLASTLGLTICSNIRAPSTEEFAGWKEIMCEALSGAATPGRLVLEASSLPELGISPDQLSGFETWLGLFLARIHAISLCQYDVRDFDGPTLLQALKLHPDVHKAGLGAFLV
jgi:excisionase family DNA binding protein